MIKLQAQSTSNGCSSDAYATIDHPDKTDTKTPIKTDTKLPLVKMLKVLSLSLGLTRKRLQQSLYSKILLDLVSNFNTIVV
jgi:hypothetical protein